MTGAHTASQRISARRAPIRATSRELGIPTTSMEADSAANTTLMRTGDPVVSSTNHGNATTVMSDPTDEITSAAMSASSGPATSICPIGAARPRQGYPAWLAEREARAEYGLLGLLG